MRSIYKGLTVVADDEMLHDVKTTAVFQTGVVLDLFGNLCVFLPEIITQLVLCALIQPIPSGVALRKACWAELGRISGTGSIFMTTVRHRKLLDRSFRLSAYRILRHFKIT